MSSDVIETSLDSVEILLDTSFLLAQSCRQVDAEANSVDNASKKTEHLIAVEDVAISRVDAVTAIWLV